jgi:hypothetical protein
LKGFLIGTLALVVLFRVVQPDAAGKLAAGGGVVASSMARLFSPSVAGVPQRHGSAPGNATGKATGRATGAGAKAGAILATEGK